MPISLTQVFAGSSGRLCRVYIVSSTLTTDTIATVGPTSGTVSPTIVPRLAIYQPALVGTDTTSIANSAFQVNVNPTTGIVTLQRLGSLAGTVTSTDTTSNGTGRLIIWDDLPDS